MVKQITEIETDAGKFKAIIELILSKNNNTLYFLEYCEFNEKEYPSIDEIEKDYKGNFKNIKEEIESKLFALHFATQANKKMKEKNGE